MAGAVDLASPTAARLRPVTVGRASRGFALIALDQNGECDGGAVDICRGCIGKVANDALDRLSGWLVDYSDAVALKQCGPAVDYRIVANLTDEYRPRCAECGRVLAP